MQIPGQIWVQINNAGPALEHALETMKRDTYRNADLLVVSDFIMANLSDDLLDRIESCRLNGNRFHSLVVGSCYMIQRLKDLFDNEWVFEPSSSQIHELVRFERNINARISARQ